MGVSCILINLNEYSKIITIAKIPPSRRAGSTITLIIFYPSSRASGSIRLTKIKAKVIGIIINAVPQNILPKKFPKDAVISY